MVYVMEDTPIVTYNQIRLRYVSGIAVMLLPVDASCDVYNNDLYQLISLRDKHLNCNLNLIVSLLIPICYP